MEVRAKSRKGRSDRGKEPGTSSDSFQSVLHVHVKKEGAGSVGRSTRPQADRGKKFYREEGSAGS